MTETDLRETIQARLESLGAARAFLDINRGQLIAELTDYYVQQVPDNWTAPPPELVDGRDLTPLLKDNEYLIYCHEAATGILHVLDLESPWPPTDSFSTWPEFMRYLFEIISEDASEQEQARLKQLLGLEG